MINQALVEALTRYVRLHYQPEVEQNFKEPDPAFKPLFRLKAPTNKLIDEQPTKSNLKHIKVGPTFSTLVIQFMRTKNIDTVDFYKSISVSRQLFSKIISNEHYRPTKDTVLKFAIGMKLTLAETNLLMHASSFAFQTSSFRDLYIQALIEGAYYSPLVIDEVLVRFNLKPLFSL